MSRVDHCGPRPSCHDDHHDRGGPEHLQHVRLGDRDYNLNDPKERKAFEKALEKQEGAPVEYDPKTNKVFVDGEEKYDLDRSRDAKKFQADRKDGEVDGVATAKYLQDVEINGQHFNLATTKGREDFAADMADGKIDGHKGDPAGNISFNPETNQVVVVGEDGPTSYHLDNFEEFATFKADASDGALDGMFGSRPAPAPPVPPTPTPVPPPATDGGPPSVPQPPGKPPLVQTHTLPPGGTIITPTTFGPPGPETGLPIKPQPGPTSSSGPTATPAEDEKKPEKTPPKHPLPDLPNAGEKNRSATAASKRGGPPTRY